MPDLIAQGAEPTHRWRRPVEEGHRYILGRAAGTWSTPWDPQISRRHAEISWREGRLQVEMLPESQNPIFVRGRQRSSFAIRPGEHFVIGATTFTLSSTRAQVSLDAPQPVTEQRYTSSFLQNARYRYADQRIDVLSRLPELIKGAGSDEELLVRLVNVLLAGIPGSSAVAIVDVESRGGEEGGVRVLHWDRRFVADGDFAPSAKLIRKAMEKQESVVHLWGGTSEISASSFTQSDDADWAFCVPIPGESCQGWGIYVAGHARVRTRLPAGASDPFDLRDELKFTELAAATISGLRDVRLLERHQASLRQFFSPVVLEALAGQDPHHALTPRETEVTVLFCDLRGFSRSAEQSSGNLLELLERVSQALGVMTHHILDQGGVVGDFHGDAAMGFWGWPLAVPQLDAVQRACRAALGIRRDFAEGAERDHSALIDFRVGIGIATGKAVAGRIGTIDQVKVTVFGPVVNLASRLESMTKRLQASILLDETTAQVARRTLVPEEARLRRVAKVQPYGMQVALEVSELLPTWRDDPTLTDENLAAYEAALDALLRGDWNHAFRLLHAVPADDRVKDFLTVLIAAHNRTPPPNWNGVIQLDSK